MKKHNFGRNFNNFLSSSCFNGGNIPKIRRRVQPAAAGKQTRGIVGETAGSISVRHFHSDEEESCIRSGET